MGKLCWWSWEKCCSYGKGLIRQDAFSNVLKGRAALMYPRGLLLPFKPLLEPLFSVSKYFAVELLRAIAQNLR
jgi:hypothetical protein